MPSTVKRQSAAVMFTDIAGYPIPKAIVEKWEKVK